MVDILNRTEATTIIAGVAMWHQMLKFQSWHNSTLEESSILFHKQ